MKFDDLVKGRHYRVTWSDGEYYVFEYLGDFRMRFTESNYIDLSLMSDCNILKETLISPAMKSILDRAAPEKKYNTPLWKILNGDKDE